MSKVRVSRQGININRPSIKFSNSRYKLLANENENEEKVKQREEKEYYESLPNFNINYLNKRGKPKKFKCDTPEKKRLHPLCIQNNDLEKETKKYIRQQKIRNLFNEYQHKVGPAISLKNPLTKEYNPGYEEFRNKYVSFIEDIRNNPNKEWIYEHYYSPYELNLNNPENEYIHNHLLSYTQRQRLRLRGHLFEIIQNIKTLYFENKKNNSPIIQNINSLFTSVDIHNKINFNFNFDTFIQKFKTIRYFMKDINRKYFLDPEITGNMINGKKHIENIFDDFEKKYPLNGKYKGKKIFYFLIQNNILDEIFNETYYLQYTHRYRVAATYGLIELINIYKARIYFLYKLIRIQDLTKQKLTELIINELILPCIEKYLFYINFGMINNFRNKEAIFETCFEDFYYYHLKLNLHFIVNFLNCENKNFRNNYKKINEGVYGDIYNIIERKNNSFFTNKILKKSKKPVLERAFFEFFKQCCIVQEFDIGNNSLLKNIVPKIYEMSFGQNEVYIKMEKIEGDTLLKEYYNDINLHNKNLANLNTYKEKKIINLLLKLSNIIKECQIKKFIHNDFNLRNIMINSENQIKLIDFDFSIIFTHNLYLFNYVKKIDFKNIFEYNDGSIELSNFSKSIDLFRCTMYIFFLGNYINSYITKYNTKTNPELSEQLNKYNLSSSFSDSLRNKLYGTTNNIIPENIKSFFEGEKNPIRYKKEDPRAYFSNFLFVRNHIFKEFANMLYPEQELIRNEWILQNQDWIENFIPENFIEIIQYFNIYRNNAFYNATNLVSLSSMYPETNNEIDGGRKFKKKYKKSKKM